MQAVYEAANAIEAHMIADLLKQDGIEAHIHGAALQGAMGEVPLAGLVRLMVDDAQHAAARAVIERWERTEVDATPPAQPAARRSGLSGIGMLLLGLALGVGGSYLVYRMPINHDTADYNGDGVMDEWASFSSSGRVIKTETDRNFDGKVDHVTHHDARGLAHSSTSDNDFDGVFETSSSHVLGQAETVEIDSDGDGFKETVYRYTHGVTDLMEVLDPVTGRPLRIYHFKLDRLQFADVDSDRDGTLDTRIRYTPLGEVAAREPLMK